MMRDFDELRDKNLHICECCGEVYVNIYIYIYLI